MPINKTNIIEKLYEIIKQKVSIDKEKILLDSKFAELGIDSMLMIDLVESISKEFRINLSLTEIIIQYNSINKLNEYILSTSKEKNIEPEKEVVNVHSKQIDSFSKQDILNLISQQRNTLEVIFSKQLDVISSTGKAELREPINSVCTMDTSNNNDLEADQNVYIPFQKIEGSVDSNLSEVSQINSVKKYIESLLEKTDKSKQLVTKYRKNLADADEVAGFNMLLKEIQYQISVDHTEGAYMVDVNGNTYIDIAMGFGSLLLGHSPDFLMSQIKSEVERGMQLASRHRLLGSVSKKLCTITGFDRVTYTATGTEAVMTAIRIARCYTAKEKIVVFSGGYHGHSDMTLVTKTTSGDTIPVAPGIPVSAISDTIVLKYNDINNLKMVSDNASEIAAVIVEPVQSRRPDIHPKEFLIALREVTAKSGVLLIFDEIVTGFRCNIGGAQKYFGIVPDLVTYGKAICNGMPMGVVAGNGDIMDSVDGGDWKYDDGSYPHKKQTYTGGTFFKHPFSLAAADATLSYMLEKGNGLQEMLTEKTSKLVNSLNNIFINQGVDIRVYNFASLFKFFATGKNSYLDLFYALLLEKGIYTWNGRTCFLSTAHSDQDIECIIKSVADIVETLIEAGIYKETGEKMNVLMGFSEELPNELFYE